MTSTEARELELVGKVEMRIALAKDDKLESILKPYLAPLLLKLGSEHVSVRNKVVSTCQHIKIRLAGNQAIILPVAALLKQYKENSNFPMIRHFDLMFIQQSIGKLSSPEQMSLLPTILHGLAQDADKPTCATIFNLLLRLLPQLQVPPRGSKEDGELRGRLGLDDHVEDAQFVASWFSKLMLLSIVKTSATTGVTCPGLTVQEYDFLTLNGKQDAWNATSEEGLNLTQTKLVILTFLASGAFTDQEKFISALFASADTNSRISSIGDDLLKRTTVSLEDPDIIQDLLRKYFALKPALQTRVLTLLTKSAVSTTFPSQIIKIVKDAIQPDDNTNVATKGLETTRFRNSVFNYMSWVSRIASTADLAHVAPQLVDFLQRYIEDQGWPIPNEKTLDATSLRALAYETLGSLAKTTPSIVLDKDLVVIRWLLRSLTEEGSSDSIFVSIEGALSSLLGAFKLPLEPEIQYQMRHLLLSYMTLPVEENITRSARFTAVRWANRCLEYSDVVGRWIDILALGGPLDERSEVVEEGKKGLDPYWYNLLTPSEKSASLQLPDWNAMVKAFFTSQSILENSSIANSTKSGMTIDSVSVFGNFSGSKLSAFSTAVLYSRQVLLMAALEKSSTPLVIDADWERQLDVVLRTNVHAVENVRQHISLLDRATLHIYLNAAFEGMLRNDGNGLQHCGKCFVEVTSMAPLDASGRLAERALELLSCLKSNNDTTRFLAAHAFGILVSHPYSSADFVESTLKSMLNNISNWATAVGADANNIHGYILAIGYTLSRLSYWGRLQDINQALIRDAILDLLVILSNVKDRSTKEAVLFAVGEVSASAVISPTDLEISPLKVSGSIELLTAEAKKGDEKSISALGRLAIIFEDQFSEKSELVGPLAIILQSLYGLFELKQTEAQFAVGESLCCLAACWESEVLSLGLDVDAAYSGRSKRHKVLMDMLSKLLQDCKTTKPSLKKASGIWLFSLIQHCGHLEELQSRLRECQVAFMGLLSARDELVQETASRGLTLVYERGDEELRGSLVKDLVASFTGSSTALKVDEETELFEPGALPTGEGSSVTSYKDIISLANEVGDQSLVYKFMSLASNAATWSTRAAFGRFGLSSILSESEVDPKIYPKLYRYRFDPNPNVRRSMNDIWNALVKDSGVTINLNFDDILADLLKNILGKEWRTREASCAAIADLVQGREFDKYEKHLQDIWHVAFKVLDDIKGSVREAALKLSMALTNILVRQVEAGNSSKHAQSMLRLVLPFLLSEQGMESSAEEVRLFATVTVIKLINSGGKALLPFVTDLIDKLLGLLSTIEPEGINYLYQRAADRRDKIDQIRSTAVSQSPLMEAIERCLDVLDETAMKELAPRLENCVKTMIGMPSKIGCAAVLSNLAMRHPLVFRPHADNFLKIVEKAVLDRNSTVSAAYARSSGYLSRLATEAALSRLGLYSKDLYFNAEDESKRQIAGEIVYAFAKFASDQFNAMAAAFLPFVFFAKHDYDDEVKKQFEKIWDENVGGSRTVILYASEINSLSVECLESPKWTTKHTAALTIADVVDSSGAELSHSYATAIWPSLERALSLKTFDGKEKVLQSFIKLTRSGKSLWEKEPSIAAQMRKIAIREAKRNNDDYRPHAFEALGDFAAVRQDINIYEDVFDIVKPVLEELIDEERMDTTGDTNTESKSTEVAVLNAGVAALFKSLNFRVPSSSALQQLPNILDVIRKVIASPKAATTTRIIIYEETRTIFEKLTKQDHSQQSSQSTVARDFFDMLEIQSDFGTEVMRQKRAEAGEMIAAVVVGGTFGHSISTRNEYTSKIREVVDESQKHERSPVVRSVLSRVLNLLEENKQPK